MDPHPHREELLRLNYSAELTQRGWRKFVHSREEKMRRLEALRLVARQPRPLHELLRELREMGTS